MAEDLSRTLSLLRDQRHSFLNHLQVISGWLQLGKTERAQATIARAVARMEAEGQALRRIDSPEFGLFVLEMGLEAEPYGVLLEWSVTGPLDPRALPDGRERLKAALEETAGLPEEQRRLRVVLGGTVTIHRPPSQGEG